MNRIKDLAFLEKDDNGKDIIEMVVRDDSNFLSPYSGKNPDISSDVSDFLDSSIKGVLPSEEIKIVIKSNVIDDSEKEIDKQAIKNHYDLARINIERRLITNGGISLIMFLVGLFVIGLLIFLDQMNVQKIWTTIVEIAGWVFIWEAVDKFFIERKSLKLEKIYALKMINAEIIYDKLDQ